MTNESKQPKPLVPAEDLSAEVDELLSYATERGRSARTPQRPVRGPAPVHTTRPDKPEIKDLLHNELASILEDEVLPAVNLGPDRGILEWELQHEVAKKALVGLKKQTLRNVAERMRLDKRGRSEDIADRIARAYRDDEREIAQLVLDYEEEPAPERGHVDRVFPLMEALAVGAVAERLKPVIGRYVRVGVARWFVFEDMLRTKRALTLRGSLKAYRTFVTTETTEEKGDAVEVPRLDALQTEVAVEIEILDGVRAIRIRGAGTAPSRAAASALEAATGVRLLGYVPFASQSFEGALGGFAASTTFMLDFLDNRLAKASARDPNPTVARFELESGDVGHQGPEGDRPTLREVRFEGDHLLDDLSACRLIAIEGRALIDLSVRVSFGDGPDPARFLVRLSLESDHAVVLTGYGRHQPGASAELHRTVVQAVERAFVEGVANTTRLESFAEKIDAFARSNRGAEHATMLREPDDIDTS